MAYLSNLFKMVIGIVTILFTEISSLVDPIHTQALLALQKSSGLLFRGQLTVALVVVLPTEYGRFIFEAATACVQPIRSRMLFHGWVV